MFLRIMISAFIFIFISCSNSENNQKETKNTSYQFRNDMHELSINFYTKDKDVFGEIYSNNDSLNIEKKPIIILFNRKDCNLCISEFISLLNVKRNTSIHTIMLSQNIPQKIESHPLINFNEAKSFIYTSQSFNNMLDSFINITKLNFREENDPIIFMLDSNNKLLKVYEGVVIEESIQKDIKNLFCNQGHSLINCDKV